MNLQALYERFIKRAITRNGKPLTKSKRRAGYEIHHILARSLGGADDAFNLVYLTPKEHYTAHHILARLHRGPLVFAFWRMSHGKKGATGYNQPATARQYATAKLLVGATLKANPIRNNGGKRKPMTQEHKERLSRVLTGLKKPAFSNEHKRKMAIAATGRVFTEERKANIKASLANVPVFVCPHCGRSFKAGAFARFHGDNCKHKQT